MSLNPNIRDRAYQFFIEEAQELLQVIEKGLLDLREHHSTPKVHELMRAAHSIKGGAASVELSAIELLAHRLEDFFKALYNDSVDFDAELESLLLQGYDCLANPLNEQIESGSHDEETALLNAEPVFQALETRLETALKNADSYIPSSNDLGVDIVASIFEIDVAQAIEHLQEIVNDPASFDLAQEFQETLDLLSGFAELFNLPGFSSIIQTAQTALEQNPDRILKIIRATIADCTVVRDLVLAGDREQGGEVSAALIELAQSTDSEAVFGDTSNFISVDSTDEIEDVFGTLGDVTDSVEDIFSEIPNAVIPEIETTEETIATSNDLSDIFGEIPNAVTPEIEAAEEAIATSDEIENVFGTLDDATDSVEDIFGEIPDTLTTAPETSPASNITQETIDDVDRIFNNFLDTTPVTENTDTSDTRKITDAVQSIENAFDRLPSVEADVTSLFAPDSKTAQKQAQLSQSDKTKPQQSPQAPAKLTVRVDLERLERMNNLVGELTINRNSLALQNEELQEGVSELGQKFLRFRAITQKLREISDRMILEQRSGSLRNLRRGYEAEDSQPYSEFDTLEMDNYSDVYASIQNVLEEIVQLEESVDDITIFAKQSDRTISSQRQMLGQMRDELMWVRMLPLERILQHFPRTLRDLSSKYNKPVALKLHGTGVLVDKVVLEKLSDPLLHLLRNAFDHGIESSEERINNDKPANGTIEIHAYYQGNQTVIEVKDDGKGLDVEKIAQKAIAKGLISASEAANASPEKLYELIFEPGFSTKSQVSELSGRGVGMNIVRSQIETLKGRITVTSSVGKGSIFTLRLPLTLTIAKLLVCSLGSTAFAIPSDSIEEIVIPTEEQIKTSNRQKFLSLDGKLIPIYPLKEILEYNCSVADAQQTSKAFKTIASPEDWLAPLLLLRRGQQLFALEVVDLVSEQELVIKPYGKAIAAPRYSYGCTILGDGSLIPVFDGAALINTILGVEVDSSMSGVSLTPNLEDLVDISSDSEISETIPAQDKSSDEVATTSTNKPTTAKTIMIVDDSTALRRTMALTLEKQGYRVIQKKDGREALDGFRNNPDLDLIICDVEMPTMNGFEFLGMRRRDSNLSQVPTFMLTSRSGAKHRNLAKQLGADGYFTKPYIEQEFVAEINKILVNNNSPKEKQPNINRYQKKTILVIDDSSALRGTLSLALENNGYRVLQGRDGAEGLELLRNNPDLDLVICDVEMPNMNGFEFLTARRQEPNLLKIPVIMLTSRSSEKHRSLANSLGANGYFTKPYVQEKFLEDINSLIQKYSKNK